MPNLLKSLPREILEQDDSKFIYNILNPLLFEKVPETTDIIRKEFDVKDVIDLTVSDITNTTKYNIPYNVDSRNFHAYIDDGYKKTKVERYSSAELLITLDDIKEYINFYFNIEGYEFLQPLIGSLYYLEEEVLKNKRLYETNYKKYITVVDIKQKQILKQTYLYFKTEYDKFKNLLSEYELVLSVLSHHADYSISQLIDNIALTFSNKLNIKSFDNEIIFAKSELFKYLTESISIADEINKHTFIGKMINSTTTYQPNNIIELITIFAFEISSIVVQYKEYTELLVNNGDCGYALKKSETKQLKNKLFESITIDLDSDNLTYYLDEEANQLEIYVYFDKHIKIDESTLKVSIDGKNIIKSITSLRGAVDYGYSTFNYIDDTTKYYKITVNKYLVKDLNGINLNGNIENIILNFTALETLFETVDPTSPILETTKFIDNFVMYKKTPNGFYEEMKVPFKVLVDLDEKEERYTRTFEIKGIDDVSHSTIISEDEIIISYCLFEYVYTPSIYTKLFNNNNNTINFRYQTILEYVLIDDVMGKDFELEYYSLIDETKQDFNTNINKNVLMDDGKVYKQLFDQSNQMMIMNPYNETNIAYVAKIDYGQYDTRAHTRESMIDTNIKKIPFYNNLKYLDLYQYDIERDAILFLYRGFQYAIPVSEILVRNKNYEQIVYNIPAEEIYYCDQPICQDDNAQGFVFANEKIYLKHPETQNYDLMELVPLISMTPKDNGQVYYDIHNECHCVISKNNQYRIEDMYMATIEQAMSFGIETFFIESTLGIPRFKDSDNNVFDVDIYNNDETSPNGYIKYDEELNTLSYINGDYRYDFNLTIMPTTTNLHRLQGMNLFSMFYAGNTLPENSNQTFFGRENIYSSMSMADNIYDIGRSEDKLNDSQQHRLIAEQLDLNIDNAPQYNKETEAYIMSKSSTASLKGLESYLISNLKSISQDINVSPVYLVQRNRFISEWAKVSTVLPTNDFAEESLKGLVQDLMETKLIQGEYDDLIDIFKANKYEDFSLATNNIHNVLILYIQRYLMELFLEEDFSHYLIHDVWLKNKQKDIIDFINETASDDDIKIISAMTFTTNLDKEKLFYTFIKEMEKDNKYTISTYKPLANYSDWIDVEENNNVHFEKPFSYEVIDISKFIDLPIDWSQPLLMIRPLVDDGVFVKRDYRFLDVSMMTNSVISNIDLYNEYLEEDVKRLNKTLDYTAVTLDILYSLSLSGNYDYLAVNLVIIKWIVERYLPNYLLTNSIETVEELTQVIKTELLSAEHPNMIVDYNKIKESTLLMDLGSNVEEIYDTIVNGNMLQNSIIELEVSDEVELAYLDKIKKPVEHYFEYLFGIKRHDIITKVLALFTEDVIATSMIDLSMAINIKNTNGDETFDIYENMINELFSDFLPFHSVLDKILFSIKIMETSSSEAVSKQADIDVKDLNYIDILTTHTEKIRIQTLDSSIVTTRVNVLFPSENAKSCRDYELPHDYTRSIKMAGHSMFEHGMDDMGMDDEWFIDEDNYDYSASRATPPEFSDTHWMCIPESDYEAATDVYLTEYYHIKEDIFNKDDRITSHFIDFVPTIEITQGISEEAEVEITEDYLIAIDAAFNIRFYDMENIGMDEYGLDVNSGPEDQSALIGMKEAFIHDVMHDFYEKMNIFASDTVWTDIKVVYDLLDIPGHDDFGVDEYYHQQHPDNLGQDMSVMAYDELLHQGFNTTVVDMADISLIDKAIAEITMIDREITSINTIDTLHTEISIITGRGNNGAYVLDGAFVQPGQDEFGLDEYYHNSNDWERLANMVDTLLIDALGDIRIDFGFMRMLPIDPYQDLIDQKFYREDQPGSEIQTARIRDKFITNVHTFGKDFIRANMMDVTNISIISEDIRRIVYNGIEEESIGTDLFDVQFADSLVARHIHHDFRENIVALDKYAAILDDAAILEIFGTRAADIERDELFELRIGDILKADISMKTDVDRVMTTIDKDYLKAIKIEEENFVSFSYIEREVKVRFNESLALYFEFNETSRVDMTDEYKAIIGSFDKETTSISMLDKLHYGTNYTFDIDGMTLGTSDALLEMWDNKIYRDSMIMSITDTNVITTDVVNEYTFGLERTVQEHDMYGQMGYTEESVDRSIDSKLTDSLLTQLNFTNKESSYVETYDTLMRNIEMYFGEVITVTISDSLETYIDMVKTPWVLQAFDTIEHDDGPHMYHGEDEEFGITTELRDQLIIDADTFLYNAGALVTTKERIFVVSNAEPVKDDVLSATLVDDLKVISIGMKEIATVNTEDEQVFRNEYKEQMIIGIQDKIWYGYKMESESSNILPIDTLIDYGYEGVINKDMVVNTQIRDWLLLKINFNENLGSVVITDSDPGIDTNVQEYDTLSATITDTLSIHDSNVHTYYDSFNVGIRDNVSVHSNEMSIGINPKDVATTTIAERLQYGPGKWFNETVRGYIQNRLSIYEEAEAGPDMDITATDSFHEYTTLAPFVDKVGATTYERLKYGLVFKDKLDVSILRDEHLKISREWVVNRFGVDEVVHGDLMMEWEDDASVDNTTTTSLYDDVVMIDTHLLFTDKLDILSQENIGVSGDSTTVQDGITITSSDNLMYGIGLYDYIWDAKDWENYGYEVPYENYSGLVPHDDFPYDEAGHDQQGDDLSQISTGVTENLLYGFDHFFKETIGVQTQDNGGFNTWGYQSVFKDTVSVWVDNRLMSSYADTDDKMLDIHMRKEQMSVAYDFEDTTKTHLFTEENGISKEEINTYDMESQQLLESIFKYRIYEKIDVEVNENLLSSALFKYDDEISLVTDYNTKIDLYKEQSDGSLARSMTVVKDSTTSHVTLFFGDYVNAIASDYVQGTSAERPDEYIE